MNNKNYSKDLKLLILKILEHKYSCAHEIMQILKDEELEFENRQFYPTLSNLQLKNYLCTNWIKNKEGKDVKYYHLTKNGYNFIHQ
ncbi:MAG: hypothetical protein HC831_17805 [Chloroflexia bacterium]|nr:hypothetical protein [Chloroflexia bacterium]